MDFVMVRCGTLENVNWQLMTMMLPPGELIVYKISLSDFYPVVPFLSTLLHTDEQNRAVRYHQLKDQQRFIIARSLLRLVLSRYTHRNPAELMLITGPTKKPTLSGFPDLHYNVAHSGMCLLIGIGTSPVGVDVEEVRQAFAYQDVLATNFSTDERQFVGESDFSRSAFYRLWTRKEALTKATAKGIDDDFSAIPALDGTHRVSGKRIGSTHDWRIDSFMPAENYVAALAYSTASTALNPQFYTITPATFSRL